jgi:ABC-type dipeptide/oligopeptide/nickel transport system permease component
MRVSRDELRFDFGESFFRSRSVIGLVLDRLPVSISLGLWTTLLVYLVSIPLGIRKAIRDGSRFDVTSSSILIVLNAIPAFLFSILLVAAAAVMSIWSVAAQVRRPITTTPASRDVRAKRRLSSRDDQPVNSASPRAIFPSTVIAASISTRMGAVPTVATGRWSGRGCSAAGDIAP